MFDGSVNSDSEFGRGSTSLFTTTTSFFSKLRRRKAKKASSTDNVIRIVGVLALPAAILLAQTAYTLNEDVDLLLSSEELQNSVASSILIEHLTEMLEIEAGYTIRWLASSADEQESMLERLKTLRSNTTDVLDLMPELPPEAALRLQDTNYENKNAFREFLLSERNAVRHGVSEMKSVINLYKEMTENFIYMAENKFLEVTRVNDDQMRTVFGLFRLMRAKEEIGVERSQALLFFLEPVEHTEEEMRINNRNIINANNFIFEAPKLIEEELEKIQKMSLYKNITNYRREISHNLLQKPDEDKALFVYAEFTQYMQLLRNTEHAVADLIVEMAQLRMSITFERFVVSLIVAAIVIIACPVAFVIIMRTIRIMKRLERKIMLQNKEISNEKNISEQIVHQMLPKIIADQLKEQNVPKPEMFNECTIFFSDIVGFQGMCASKPPMFLVNTLNMLYTLFDAIIDTHNCYKVETIGGSYMVVSGIPMPFSDHAGEICRMALQLLDVGAGMRVRNEQLNIEETIQVRCGVHSGPCAAGVVGFTMPRYCLFGDTVNIASRMQSSGQPARIQISSPTNDLLDQSEQQFMTSPRGTVSVKGKGDMQTFWLESVRQLSYMKSGTTSDLRGSKSVMSNGSRTSTASKGGDAAA